MASKKKSKKTASATATGTPRGSIAGRKIDRWSQDRWKEFVAAYNELRNADAVAEKFGLTRKAVLARASFLRKKKVPMPFLGRTSLINADELTKLIDD